VVPAPDLGIAGEHVAVDAAFIALAEALGIPLLTADKKFGRVPKTGCAIITV
jgi:predicted nucleic acid-binding protein